MTVWKWSGESRYPGAFPPVLENFRRAFSPVPTDHPRVSEDDLNLNIDFAKTSFLGADFIALDACFHTIRCGLEDTGDGNT